LFGSHQQTFNLIHRAGVADRLLDSGHSNGRVKRRLPAHYKVITDANGSFSVTEFPIGSFKVTIKGQQTLRAAGLKFDPDTGVPIILTIDLGPYNLVGRIYDESGQTFEGADIFLNWALHEDGVRIRSTRKTSANASGEFRFTGLGSGNHQLVVTAWGSDTFQQTVRRSVNVGVDSGELIIVFNTLQD
jgi:hypothetical protein